jgi:hypothetical protein
LWNALAFQDELIQGNIMSLIGEVEKNTWQWRESVQFMVRDIVVLKVTA